MGCGGVRSSKLTKDNEFYKEAMGFRQNNLKGIRIDDDFAATQSLTSYQIDNINIQFENYDHGDESAAVKPWLETIVCPEVLFEEDLNYPKYKLSIEHVFGLRLEDTRDALYFLSKDELLYISSGNAVIQNMDDYSQMVFGGFEVESEKECHDNVITSIAFFKSAVSLVATGQRGIKPKILIWSPVDPSVVFCSFNQPKGSKEVSSLAFDKDGRYVASLGKDENNTFFIWDLRTKELYWSCETGRNDFLLDIFFNPFNNNLCVCGVNKIIFGYIDNKVTKPVYKKNNQEMCIFTKACYVRDKYWFVGNDRGDIYVYQKDKDEPYYIKKISKGSIQCMKYNEKFKKIYISDSLNYLYTFKDNYEFDLIEKFQMNSIIKSLDVNEDEDLVMGLKNGDIIIKHLKDYIKREEIFLQSHSEGQIGGLAFVPDSRVLTSGLDNKILLYNLRSKKCESMGKINPFNPYEKDQNNPNSPVKFQDKHKSLTIAYEENKGHVAVGINNGKVSIRKGIKDLNIRVVEDIPIGKKAVLELKYTNYGDVLIVSTLSQEVGLLNPNNRYSLEKLISLDYYLITFDFDSTYKYLQAVSNDNRFIFINMDKFRVTNDTSFVKNAEWPNLTCKFGFTVQGIYLGSTDPDYISSVARANSRNLICAGKFDFKLNLMNYPTIQDGPKYYSYVGHSGKIRRIIWTPEDDKILTIAENDQSLILWNVEEEKEDF